MVATSPQVLIRSTHRSPSLICVYRLVLGPAGWGPVRGPAVHHLQAAHRAHNGLRRPNSGDRVSGRCQLHRHVRCDALLSRIRSWGRRVSCCTSVERETMYAILPTTCNVRCMLYLGHSPPPPPIPSPSRPIRLRRTPPVVRYFDAMLAFTPGWLQASSFGGLWSGYSFTVSTPQSNPGTIMSVRTSCCRDSYCRL